jgi:7-cyano-7-deazaguanine synthase
MKRAIVLLSGGLDSATTLAIAKSEGWSPTALTFRYGQKAIVEIQAGRAVSDQIGVSDHKIVNIDLQQVGGSTLLDNRPVPLQESTPDVIPSTYVPARNTILLSFSLAFAEVLGASAIFIGVNALDYSGYPDCRPEYLQAFERMAALATRVGVEGRPIHIHAPLLYFSKAEIIRKGLELGVNYGLTVSCYDPSQDGLACGLCESCRIRLKGFAEVGVADPIPYQQR